MRIKKLELFGFKSFAERQTLHFDSGVTGVVGPNGCGKSNIVDALLWVMGEHNAKNLRGNNMQDIIFNGSQNRSPLGFAEVVLTLENDGKNVPPEYENFHEIEITRRLYRDGDSEFEINKRSCRLKDITDLFLGTGVGSRAYSIIEQGRVGQIISAKPEERRHIIDEAAGITKYKAKRAAAERKIDETQVNLSRINDIVQEIEARLGVLEKQAKKAKRYKILKEEVRTKDFQFAALKWLENKAQENYLERILIDKQALIAECGELLSDLHTQNDHNKSYNRECEQVVNLSQKLFYEAQNTHALATKDLSFQHKELENKKERILSVQDEIKRLNLRLDNAVLEKSALAEDMKNTADLFDEAKNQAATASEELANIQERYQHQRELLNILQNKAQSALNAATTKQVELKSWQERLEIASSRASHFENEKALLDEQMTSAGKKIASLTAEIEAGRSKKIANDLQIESLTKSLALSKVELRDTKLASDEIARLISQKSSRLSSLEEIDGSFEWSEAQIGQFLSTQPKNAILGLLADFIEVPASWENAAEIGLKSILESLIVSDSHALATTADALNQQNFGRMRLYPADESAKNIPKMPGVQSLFNYVRPDRNAEAVQHILQRILIVESTPRAFELWSWAKQHQCILLSSDGLLLSDDGSLSSGKALKASGMLKRKREIRELELELTELKSSADQYQSSLAQLNGVFDTQNHQIETLYQENQSISVAVAGLQEKVGSLNGDFKSLQQRIVNLTQEEGEINLLLANAQNENEARNQDLNSALEAHKNLLEEVSEKTEILSDFEREMHMQREMTTVLKVKLAEITGKMTHLQENETRQAENIREYSQRLQSLATQSEELSRSQHEDSTNLQNIHERIEHAAKECAAIEQKLATQKAKLEDASSQVAAIENKLELLRITLRQHENEVSENKLHLQQHQQGRQNIDDRIYERYSERIHTFVCEYHLDFLPEQDLEKELQISRRALDNLGAVNPQAEEEFDELNTRYVFLKSQGEDLELALNQLQEAISKINRATTKCFGEAFEAINSRFSQVFPRLFNGGKAWLALTLPNDLLNTGVEIYAEPPGKKLGSIALMSGGEKALTATSLIFAIFLIKPSPFCLLDEVDAPLDEANVQRFSSLVQEISAISQFIVITHNKKTMEGAKKLYGITMETPGVSKTVSVNLTEQKKEVERITAQA